MPVADRRSPGERDDAVARAGETTTTTTTIASTASAREQPLLHIKHLNPRCKQNTSKHIIYYAGDLHTRNICKFLENMFNVKPIYTTKWSFPYGKNDKLIHLNNIRDHKGKKLNDIKSVDDLFKDFYD